ncbi:hypothetical protein KL939_001176 [Ogataea angusta]|nr:hypothetical protein KL939_001176 [Ogataea angusta]
MVHRRQPEGETTDHKGIDRHHPAAQTKDVQRARTQGLEASLPQIRQPVLHRVRRKRRQRTHHARPHPALRRNHGQGIRQRVRARHHFQLPGGVSRDRRARDRRRDTGEQRVGGAEACEPAGPAGTGRVHGRHVRIAVGAYSYNDRTHMDDL